MSSGVMWRVKLDDGSEYGPVDEDKLLSWTRDGRITPESRISSDGKTWILASQKPELGMDWLVEAPSGECFGPFHHDVLQDLLTTKKIPPNARTFRLFDKSEPVLKSEIGKLRADFERAKSEKEDEAKRARDLATELDKVKSVTAEATRRAEGLTAELAQLRADSKGREESLVAAGKREVALSAEVEKQKTALRKAELELAKSRDATAVERTRADRITDELKSAEGKRLRSAADLERLTAEKAAETTRANGLVAELGRLRVALDHEKLQVEQLKSSLAAASKREETLAEKVKADGTALEQIKSELETGRLELAKSKSHGDELSAALEQAKTYGAELEVSLKASEERGAATAAELAKTRSAAEAVQAGLSEMEAWGDKLSAALEESGRREKTLVDERETLKSELEKARSEAKEAHSEVMFASKRIDELSAALDAERIRSGKLGELLSASGCREASLEKEVQELKGALKKAEKADRQVESKGLFRGKSFQALAMLELAAQRELAQQRRGRTVPDPNRQNAGVIDV